MRLLFKILQKAIKIYLFCIVVIMAIVTIGYGVAWVIKISEAMGGKWMATGTILFLASLVGTALKILLDS